jgi:hypothetical protein
MYKAQETAGNTKKEVCEKQQVHKSSLNQEKKSRVREHWIAF